ncbi:MAG: translation initiation factor IF-2 [Deltaproteobacteria bacterium]|nr:translation initiation factor IF-2 [Deltaproteobacteria bacterium]
MSKMRIYELARELGVDNKVVIDKATELGMSGKASHSNSLDSDEADTIRRAIIRQAIGVAPERETVTTRVDKVSGATEAIVEKRKGNVIRRRKAASDEISEGTPAESVEAAPAAPAEVEETKAQGKFAEADALFKHGASEPTNTDQLQEEPVVEASVEVQEVDVVTETVETEEPRAAVAAPAAAVEEVKKGPGPRVLGKIELPQKRVVRPEASRSGVAPATNLATVPVDETEEEGEARRKGAAAKKKTRKREFSRGDLVDYEGRDVRRLGRSRARGKDAAEDLKPNQEVTTPKQSKRVVKMDEAISVGELARQMSVKASEIIAKLIELGVMATINQIIDQDTATIVAEEFGFQVESTTFDEAAIVDAGPSDSPESLKPRPPVVTVMGHVDHGKTSLLDTIRQTSVAAKEHGGITQHIGAYRVVLEDGRSVCFLDTPGHAAFTAMRARGAQITDIVILVVAADDGVMPQTIEAINHAKAAKVTIAVAVNKVDKGGANIDRIKQQLVEHGLQPEDWGGDTMFFPVSALKKTGIKELLEGILLIAEVKELKANPDRKARGTIIEARQEIGRGTVATLLVQAGTLRVGEIFVAGANYGRVRSMKDDNGQKIDSAGPSTPVEITGLDSVPEAGEDFLVVESEADAREVAANRASIKSAKSQRALATGPITLEEFARRANNMAAAELNVILKADVHGSVEAAKDSIEKLSTPKVKVRVLHAAVGGINESDIQLAIASKAIVIGFGVRADNRATADAESLGIQLRFYRIIYELIDDVKKAMAGLLDPIKEEVRIGRVEVRETFSVPKLGTVAGSYVTEGTVRRGAFVRLLRDSRVVHEGKMASLRRFKDDVKEVQSGFECGIGIEGYNDIKTGDMLEIFEIKETAATLD